MRGYYEGQYRDNNIVEVQAELRQHVWKRNSITVWVGGGNVFKDFGISVGGKTGSAETATTDVNAWFVGFAPFDKPEIAVVVMVENGGHGNYTAEAVREIMAEYFGMNTQTVQESTQAQPLIQTIL